MASQKPIKIKRSSQRGRWVAPAVGLCCVSLVSLGVALAWQSWAVSASGPAPEPAPGPSVVEPVEPASSTEAPNPDPSEPAAPTNAQPAGTADFYGSIFPQGERVTSDYFDDAVFIGDSLTSGIQLYDIMDNATVLAATGINLSSVTTAQVIDADGGQKITVLDALARGRYGKVYLMMGANGVGYLTGDQTLELYGRFLDEVKAICPDSLIYVQSILPINEAKYGQRYKAMMTNADIDSINQGLLTLAGEKGCFFLDVASAFKDDRGHMPDSSTPDGIHLYSAGYTVWFDYLKTHAYPAV